MNYEVTEKELIIEENGCVRVIMRDKILDIAGFDLDSGIKTYINMVNGKEYLIYLKDTDEFYKLAGLLNN